MSQSLSIAEVAFGALKFLVPFLFALCFHEFAHGWVARLRGDRTAEIMGRLTMNPMAHADPIGTVLLPLASYITHIPLFGWAKPVPVDERNLKNPRADMFWIAAAGPLSNLLLALVAAVGMGVFRHYFSAEISAGDQTGASQILEVLTMFIGINVFLAIFNLLPIHPLDGGKILARFLPERVNRQLEDWQMYSSMLLLAVFLMGGMRILAAPAIYISSFFMNIAYQVSGIL